MGKASITINVGALWNGSTQIDQVTSDLKRMEKLASQSSESTTRALALQGQEWVNLGNSIYNAGSSIADFGDKLTQGVTVPMATVGSYCVQQAATFDSALADLNKTADLTADELEEFGEKALAASQTSPVTADEILEAEALGAQLGISNDALEDFANTANGLDIATNMNMETAATQLAQFANITGMADDEVSNYGSAIVDLGNNLATTESNISNMALRLAGTSTAANLSSADILGLAGAMSSLGIKAEAGGSAMTTIISNISTAVAEGGDQVEEYARVCGVSADEFAAKWESSPIEAMEMMISGASDLVDSGEDVNTILSDLGVSGIRQTDVMRRLIGQSDTLKDAVDRANTAWEENTALTTEVSKRNESIEARFETLQNKVNAAATEVGTVFANALLDLADDMSPIIDGVGNLATAFGDLPDSAQGAITTLAGITAAAGPVVSISGRLVQGIGNVATKFGQVKQTAAVLGDALNTTDGSLMRVYASSKSAASTIGTLGNSAANAAGGAETYVSTWEKMVDAAKQAKDATEKYSNAQSKLVSNYSEIDQLQSVIITGSDKEAAAATKKITALQKQNEALEASADKYQKLAKVAQDEYTADAKLVSGWSNSTKEAEKAAKGIDALDDSLADVKGGFEEASTSSNSFTKGATGVTKSLAGFGKAAALSVGVAALSASVSILTEKIMENVNHAAEIESATRDMSDIFSAASSSASNLGSAIGDIDYNAEETTQKLADLNDSVQDTLLSYQTNNSMLDQYVDVIEQLGGKSNLTAIEQYRLKEAIDGYNEVCGTSYEVTDAANGVIYDTENACEASSQALADNAEEWKKNAEAQAYSEVATEYLKNQAETQVKLNQAISESNELHQRYNELTEAVNNGTATAEQKEEWQEVGKRIGEVDTSLKELQDDYDTAGENAAAATAMAEIAASDLDETVKNTLLALPTDLQSVGVDCANALSTGISNGTVSVEAATQFLSQGVGTSLSNLSGDALTQGSAAATALAQGISDGSVSVQAATDIMSAIATGDLEQVKTAYANAGIECPQSLADALNAFTENVSVASGNVETAATSGIASMNSDYGQTATDAVNNFVGNLSAGTASTYGAASSLASQANNGVSGVASSYGAMGSNASSSFASGISSGTGATSSAASGLNNAAQNAKVTGSYSWGSDLGSQFASGIRSAIDKVASAASSLASTVASYIHFSAPEKGPWSGLEKGGIRSGQDFAKNFASGITSGIPYVEEAITAMANVADPTSALGGYTSLGASGTGAVASGATVNNYTISIDGSRVNNSARAIEALNVLFDEFGLAADMA